MKKISMIFLLAVIMTGIAFAGWHKAASIVPGAFPLGDFIFNGTITDRKSTRLNSSHYS